jgi:predicted transcriptional regulator
MLGDQALGPLETDLLRLLWAREDATVRELLEEQSLDAAYTTVMTTLDRLYKKGVLERTLEGKAYRYKAKQSEEGYNRQAVAQGLRALLAPAKDPTVPISFLVDAVTEQDAAALEVLARAVERKRRELKRKGKS